jgi:hypothetical protein
MAWAVEGEQMKAIVDGKLYNTETAERIFSFRRKYKGAEISWMPGYSWVDWHDIDLYKTKKGAYFELDKKRESITPVAEEVVKNVLQKLDTDKFIEIFGEVIEA